MNGQDIEIKTATKSTLNQVRAVKYLPLVAYFIPTASWYVVPAHEVVRLVSRKARGQHTENPFESATLNLTQLSAFHVEGDGELLPAVHAAIASASRYPSLKAAMFEIRRKSSVLAQESRDAVLGVLEGLGL